MSWAAVKYALSGHQYVVLDLPLLFETGAKPNRVVKCTLMAKNVVKGYMIETATLATFDHVLWPAEHYNVTNQVVSNLLST